MAMDGNRLFQIGEQMTRHETLRRGTVEGGSDMHPGNFDDVTKLFAQRRLSRRQAMLGGAGLAAGALSDSGRATAAAQTATQVPERPAARHGPTMLFLQSFRSGTIAPKDGEAGRHTLTLEQGLGQTIYFSDRPDRLVGATPTDRFLTGLGFPENNPPNAALVVETAPGETDIAVVELFNPVHDPISDGVTYDIAVLANWQSSLEMGFTDAPVDLATLAPTFGAAHLFIDDCPSGRVECNAEINGSLDPVGYLAVGQTDAMCFNTTFNVCVPCTPWFDNSNDLSDYWTDLCNLAFSACNGQCEPGWQCSDDTYCEW